ncbi:MAG: non-heme iron oxygenase ferredoxin subunit [Novosphingobium sp.]|nr:non-heme iron oxygenase ferredoxin subunit [Novosphingobium sp.]
MTEKTFIAVARLEDVPPGGKKCVTVEGQKVLLCNTKDRIFAVENQCSHVLEPLDEGRMRSGWIACPIHGARFDLETGKPLNPPAIFPIKIYEVRIEGDDILVSSEGVFAD